MTYIAYDDVIARYPLVETWGKSESEVSSDLIYYAEIELNSRLAAAYSVPFSGPHPTVMDLAIDLAYLKALRGRDLDKAEDFAEYLNGRIDGILEGKEYIYTASGTTLDRVADNEDVWSTMGSYHPTFSMLDPEHVDSQVSSELISDLEDERD